MNSMRMRLALVGTAAALAGAAAVGVPALAADDAPATPARTGAALRVVPFDVGAVKKVGAASAPIGLPLAPSPAVSPTPVVPGGSLVAVEGVRPDLPGVDATAPDLAKYTVESAVQLPASQASKPYDEPGIAFRSVYRANVKGPEGPLLVEVIEPSVTIEKRDFEAPGNVAEVDGQTVYNAESGPGVSFATTVVQNGRFAMVSGPGTAETRVALLRGLGFAK